MRCFAPRAGARCISFCGRSSLAVLTVLTSMVMFVPVPAQASAFPGQNGRVVFATEFSHPSQIYTMRSNGSDLRQLTHATDGRGARGPEFSPDGSQIAYARNGHIWIMNSDGTAKTRLTNVEGFRDRDPSWSPDGGRLVFSHCDHSFGFSAYCDIDVVSVDGTGLTTILDDNWVNERPSFSPDGTKIAFSGTRGGFVCAVWVMGADGASPVRLTDPAMQANAPEWSPDGRQITFSTHCELPNSAVYIMNADGTGPTQITPDGHDWVNPQFSPDGSSIAVLGPNSAADRKTCCWDLYVMAPDGSGVRLIDHPHPGMVGLDWGAKVVAA
jgi:TolB protein